MKLIFACNYELIELEGYVVIATIIEVIRSNNRTYGCIFDHSNGHVNQLITEKRCEVGE